MATAGNGMIPYESEGAGERSFGPEINEEPQNVSQEAYRNVVEEQIVSLIELTKTSMTSEPHPTTMENLADDLLVNIFIRLLAKQLAQMRSVSKSWNALLSQSSFIKSHLHRSIHEKDQILLVFHSKSSIKPFTAYSCQSPHLQLTNFIKPPVNPHPEYTNGFTIIGHVHGLICSSYGDSIIHIWNPSLSAVVTLPPSSLPSPLPAPGYGSTISYRFGFDPETADYKVVKITSITAPSEYIVKWWLQVEIYSMRKGSWEITETFPSYIKCIFDEDRLSVDGHDGHLHWLCCIGENMDSKTIVAFDLGSKTFREIPLPHSKVVKQYEYLKSFGVLGGKLCLMSQVFVDKPCELWVMEEYGVAESWVKHHVFSQFLSDYTTPYGFTSHNEFLIDINCRLVLFDPIANKSKILGTYFANIPEKIVEYVDSLVWVAPVGPQN